MNQCPWTHDDIRQARQAELIPLLMGRGYPLQPIRNGNYRILHDPNNPATPTGLVAKLNFWRWPEKHLAGNTIDFFVKIEGLSFHETMLLITGKPAGSAPYDENAAKYGNNPACPEPAEGEIMTMIPPVANYRNNAANPAWVITK